MRLTSDAVAMDFETPARTGHLLELGLSEWELRKRRWERPHHGVRHLRGPDAGDPSSIIDAAVPLMTNNSVMTGWAAAYLQGVRYVAPADPMIDPVVIASPDAGQHRQRDGICATRRYVRLDERERFGGVSVATISRAAYDMALDARSLEEAVVAFDMCVSTVIHQARTSPDRLERLVARHKKTRGIARAREALTWMSSRSASPWETRTRLLALRGAGLKGLLVNTPVFDLSGHLLGVPDLLDPETGLILESDGAHHREAEQHANDNWREERFERSGLIVCRVTGLDHGDPQHTVRRMRSAYGDATRCRPRLWTTTKPRWWSAWSPGRRWD